jgi:hypothetical protein
LAQNFAPSMQNRNIYVLSSSTGCLYCMCIQNRKVQNSLRSIGNCFAISSSAALEKKPIRLTSPFRAPTFGGSPVFGAGPSNPPPSGFARSAASSPFGGSTASNAPTFRTVAQTGSTFVLTPFAFGPVFSGVPNVGSAFST